MKRKLTVLSCNHNHGNFLNRCAKSMADQTLDRSMWQWLILFDGCTDKSQEIWKEVYAYHKHRLPHVITGTRKENKNLANAKNYAMTFVDTDYVAFQDIDDQSMPERLEEQLNFLEEHPHFDVCCTLSWTLMPDDRLLMSMFDVGEYESHVDLECSLRNENCITHGSVMMRTKALRVVGGYDESDDVLGKEDWALWKKMLSSGEKFYQLQDRLYIWTLGASTAR